MDPLEVPGRLDSLTDIARYVEQAASRAGLARRDTYRLRLAVDEIATNVVVHGYDQSGTAGDLRISATVDDDRLTVCLEDSAPAYDPTSAEPPDLSLPLEDRPIGGLGVFLSIHGVDDFRYERVGSTNRSLFTVRRSVTAEAQG